MASLGTLSADQATYRGLVASATGLDPTVVTAWIGAESGWGITKAGHNYLNVGPGETYPTVEQAAGRAASLVNTQANYAGIRAAVPKGRDYQIKAIADSPWGTKAHPLFDIYANLLLDKGGVNLDPIIPGAVGGVVGGIVSGAGGSVADALTGAVGGVVKQGIELFMSGALGLVFTVAALALIALGLNRLTGTPAKERFSQVQQVAGTAASAAVML